MSWLIILPLPVCCVCLSLSVAVLEHPTPRGEYVRNPQLTIFHLSAAVCCCSQKMSTFSLALLGQVLERRQCGDSVSTERKSRGQASLRRDMKGERAKRYRWKERSQVQVDPPAMEASHFHLKCTNLSLFS